MRRPSAVAAAILCLMLSMLAVGCPSPPAPQPPAQSANGNVGATARGGARVQGVSLNDPIRPAADDNPIVLGAAKNEWAGFSIQISGVPPRPVGGKKLAYSFRVQAPRMPDQNRTIDVENLSAEQILPMPVDVNRAGFVRHTGLSAGTRPLPRALLPVVMDRGVVNLASVRDPLHATDPNSHPPEGSTEPLLLWVD